MIFFYDIFRSWTNCNTSDVYKIKYLWCIAEYDPLETFFLKVIHFLILHKLMGVIKVYAGHEFKFECKKMKKQIRARNTSDAGSTSS